MKVLVLFLLLLPVFQESTSEPVRGVVFDRQGSMRSVIVTEIGTEDRNRVFTNEQGEFEINTITSDPELEFTFVGYAPRRIKVRDEKYLKVKLKKNLLKS